MRRKDCYKNKKYIIMLLSLLDIIRESSMLAKTLHNHIIGKQENLRKILKGTTNINSFTEDLLADLLEKRDYFTEQLGYQVRDMLDQHYGGSFISLRKNNLTSTILNVLGFKAFDIYTDFENCLSYENINLKEVSGLFVDSLLGIEPDPEEYRDGYSTVHSIYSILNDIFQCSGTTRALKTIYESLPEKLFNITCNINDYLRLRLALTYLYTLYLSENLEPDSMPDSTYALYLPNHRNYSISREFALKYAEDFIRGEGYVNWLNDEILSQIMVNPVSMEVLKAVLNFTKPIVERNISEEIKFIVRAYDRLRVRDSHKIAEAWSSLLKDAKDRIKARILLSIAYELTTCNEKLLLYSELLEKYLKEGELLPLIHISIATSLGNFAFPHLGISGISDDMDLVFLSLSVNYNEKIELIPYVAEITTQSISLHVTRENEYAILDVKEKLKKKINGLLEISKLSNGNVNTILLARIRKKKEKTSEALGPGGIEVSCISLKPTLCVYKSSDGTVVIADVIDFLDPFMFYWLLKVSSNVVNQLGQYDFFPYLSG